MSPPLRFRRECGPRALAAVAGLELEAAAELLWGHRRLWLRGTAAGGEGYGTPTRALADALVRLGAGVELYDGEGRLVADVGLTPEVLARWAHERVRSPVRRLRGGQEDREPASEPETGVWTPLSAWIDRHRAGWWIYTVVDGETGHLVAAWGPKVVAGGPLEEFEDWRVARALRVFPSES